MLVYIDWDDSLRVRIGKEHLASHSYGPGYGGTGAIRLRQVHQTWFFAYRLDDDAPRGTSEMTAEDFAMIRQHIPSARKNGPQLTGIRISEDDLHELFEMVTDSPTPIWSWSHRHRPPVLSLETILGWCDEQLALSSTRRLPKRPAEMTDTEFAIFEHGNWGWDFVRGLQDTLVRAGIRRKR